MLCFFLWNVYLTLLVRNAYWSQSERSRHPKLFLNDKFMSELCKFPRLKAYGTLSDKKLDHKSNATDIYQP